MGVTIEGFTLDRFDKWEADRLRKFQVAVAERVLKARVARGFDPQPLVVTDGRPRKDYHDVKIFGVIEFARRASMAEAVVWARDRAAEISPVGPSPAGHYRDDHMIMIDGAAIRGDLKAKLMAVKPGQTVQMVNPRVYAALIEGKDAYSRWDVKAKRGKPSRRAQRRKQGWKPKAMQGQSRQAPQGVYRVVFRELVRRYGKTMVFNFSNVKLSSGVKVTGQMGKGGKRGLRDQVYPTITFAIKA